MISPGSASRRRKRSVLSTGLPSTMFRHHERRWPSIVWGLCLHVSFAVLLAALAMAGGCGKTENQPSVLLIIIDTLRADHVGCYGARIPVTPNMDALAANGTRFSQCMTSVPVTLPSISTIFTSSYPMYHGVRDNGAYALDYSLTTMAEVFRDSDYSTAAVVGAYVVADGSGIEQGFDHYDSNFDGDNEAVGPVDSVVVKGYKTMRSGDEVTVRAVEWLEDASRPFFLVVHYWDPHDPYDPPQEFRNRWPQEPYLGEVAFTDRQLGPLLDAAEKAAGKGGLITATVADHGEGLGQHKEQYHGIFIYDTTLHVPFIIHSPGLISEGLVIEEQVSTKDLAPTVLDLAGIPVPGTWQGKSYADTIRSHHGRPKSDMTVEANGYSDTQEGIEVLSDSRPDSEVDTASAVEGSGHSAMMPRPPKGPQPCYIETYRTRYSYQWSELVGVRHNGWKLIRAPRPELYNLVADPAELDNVHDQEPEKVRQLESILVNMLEEFQGPLGQQGPETDLAEAEVEKLKTLGYVVSQEPPATGDLPDPKDRIDEEIIDQQVQEQVLRARILLQEGDEEAAARALESALRLDPDDPDALDQLGILFWRQGDRDRAVSLLEEAARLAPSSSTSQFNLGIAYMQLGQYQDAARQFKALVSLNPKDADSRYRYGKALQAAGDVDRALEQYSKCLELNPTMTLALYDSAVIMSSLGNTTEAEEHLERLLEINPKGELAKQARILLERLSG